MNIKKIARNTQRDKNKDKSTRKILTRNQNFVCVLNLATSHPDHLYSLNLKTKFKKNSYEQR